jgi:hypothetical protein
MEFSIVAAIVISCAVAIFTPSDGKWWGSGKKKD